MGTNIGPLTPVKVRDKNGHYVTRWVRLLDETGEHAINVPAPASPAAPEIVDSTLWRLLPEFEDDTFNDIFGQTWDYTDIFTRHALELLPPKTMVNLNDQFNDDGSPGQCFLALTTYQYIMLMHDYGREEESQRHYESGVRALNNALLFRETLNDTAEVGGVRLDANSIAYILNWALATYESNGKAASENKGHQQSSVDYSKLPLREREHAKAYLIAFRLNQYFGKEDSMSPPPKDLVDLLAENSERSLDVMKVVKERGIGNMDLLRERLNSDIPSLSEGIL